MEYSVYRSMIPSFLLAVAVQIGWKSKRFTATLMKSKPFHKPRFSHQKGAFGVSYFGTLLPTFRLLVLFHDHHYLRIIG
jgi:hypothetical protein